MSRKKHSGHFDNYECTNGLYISGQSGRSVTKNTMVDIVQKNDPMVDVG